jgi:hypothetical protein
MFFKVFVGVLLVLFTSMVISIDTMVDVRGTSLLGVPQFRGEFR